MKIEKNKRLTEANVTFEVCYQHRQLNIDFSQEYKITKLEMNFNRGCRFDIVVIKDNNIIGIMECKKRSPKKNSKTSQIKRYEMFGIPVFLVGGHKEIPNAIEFAKKCIHSNI